MVASLVQFVIVGVAVLCGLAAGSKGRFRGGEAAAREFLAIAGGRVQAGEVRAKLQDALESIFSAGDQHDRLKYIEQRIAPTFKAMPQFTTGRAGPQAVRHVLRSFFAKQHGWSVFGLEQAGSTAPDVLQDKLPALLEAVLEAHEHGRGLTLSEVAALATALERIILDESVHLLRIAYNMNGYDDAGSLSHEEANEVLVSYLVFFKLEEKENIDFNPEGHMLWKNNQIAAGNFLPEMQFAWDSLSNFDFAQQGQMNPFMPKHYSFEQIARIVGSMAEMFGSWQDSSCKVMQNKLDSLDKFGTGLVPYVDFNAIGDVLPIFVLSEEIEDLRRLPGVLDESVPNHPMVRIANYVSGQANCGAFSKHFHVCCFNLCDSIMEELELKFESPTADPELLLAAVANLSDTPDQDLNIAGSTLMGTAGQRLRQSLHSIAQRSNGRVPLQGHLFAKWLHFAFPRQCPMPVKQLELAEVQMPAEVIKQVTPQEWATDIESHIEFHMPENSDAWTQEEEVTLFDGVQITSKHKSSIGCNTMRLLAMLVSCTAILRIAFQHCGTIAKALQLDVGKSKKHDDFQLPLRF